MKDDEKKLCCINYHGNFCVIQLFWCSSFTFRSWLHFNATATYFFYLINFREIMMKKSIWRIPLTNKHKNFFKQILKRVKITWVFVSFYTSGHHADMNKSSKLINNHVHKFYLLLSKFCQNRLQIFLDNSLLYNRKATSTVTR